MFTKRQTVILRMLLSYGLSNRSDICEAFQAYDLIGTCGTLKKSSLKGVVQLGYNGEVIPEPTENEMEEILKLLQG